MIIISDFQYGVIDKELQNIIAQAHKYQKNALVDMQCTLKVVDCRVSKFVIIFPTEKDE